MPPITVLIADGNRALARVMAELLDDDDRFRVTAVVDTPGAALTAARRRTPDVVLVDPKLREADAGLCPGLRALAPSARLVLWQTGDAAPAAADVDRVIARGSTFAELTAQLCEVAGAWQDVG